MGDGFVTNLGESAPKPGIPVCKGAAATVPRERGDHGRDNSKASTGRPRGSRGSTTSSAAASRATGCTWSRGTRARARRRSALQFLLAGRGAASPASTSRSRRPRRSCASVAASHGWSLDGITICELQTAEESLKADSQYTLFHPSEVELLGDDPGGARRRSSGSSRCGWSSTRSPRCGCWPATRCATAGRSWPSSSTSPAGAARCCCSTTRGSATGDFQLQSLDPRRGLASSSSRPSYGGAAAAPAGAEDARHPVPRRLSRLPHRAPAASQVFPRLVAAEHRAGRSTPAAARERRAASSTPCSAAASTAAPAPCSSGRPGVGKSTLAAQYVAAAAERGRPRRHLLLRRGAGHLDRRAPTRLGLRPAGARRRRGGSPSARSIPPSCRPASSPSTCAGAVEAGRRRIVVIDSLNGYLHAMPEERFLLAPPPRAALLPQPAGGGDDPGHGPARAPGRGPGVAGGPQLPGGHGASCCATSRPTARCARRSRVVKRRTGAHEGTDPRAAHRRRRASRVGRELREFQGVLTGAAATTSGRGRGR